MSEIIILGGGVAGLSAGIYARLCGHSATIIEKQPLLGGNLTGWRRGGVYIDNCIHWLTGTNPKSELFRIWENLGMLGDVDIHRPESLFTVESGGQRLTLYRDLDRTVEEMLLLSPSDAEAILTYKRSVTALKAFCGLTEFSPGKIPALLSCLPMSAGRFSEKFKHPLLQKFAYSLTGKDFSVLAPLSVAAHFTSGNADIPYNGSLAAAERMANRFISLGGSVMIGNAVRKVNLDGMRAKSVTLSDGNVIEAENLIIAADPFAIFGTVLGAELPDALAELAQDPKSFRFSSWQTAFLCDTGKLNFSGDLICDIPQKFVKAAGSERIILREFSHEPEFAPPGKTVLQTMVMLREPAAMRMIDCAGDAEKYKSLKGILQNTASGIISETIPGISDGLQPLDVWTPATYRRFTGAPSGAYMSFITKPGLPMRRIRSKLPEFENIYLATQWQNTPGGLPLAAEAGRRAVMEIQ